MISEKFLVRALDWTDLRRCLAEKFEDPKIENAVNNSGDKKIELLGLGCYVRMFQQGKLPTGGTVENGSQMQFVSSLIFRHSRKDEKGQKPLVKI